MIVAFIQEACALVSVILFGSTVFAWAVILKVLW